MPTTPSSSEAAGSEPLIPFSRLAAFVRQLSHDIRNGLNAMDLQAVLIAESTTDPEIAADAKKLRGMVGTVTRDLQKLSARFAEIKMHNAIFCPVRDFLDVLRERIGREFPEHAPAVEWQLEAQRGEIETDFELLITALSEIFRNGFQFRAGEAPVEFRAREEDAHIVFQIRAQSSPGAAAAAASPETWGREPLVSTRRGGYGLGLFYTQRIIRAHRGTLDAAFENGTTVTQVRLPLKTIDG